MMFDDPLARLRSAACAVAMAAAIAAIPLAACGIKGPLKPPPPAATTPPATPPATTSETPAAAPAASAPPPDERKP